MESQELLIRLKERNSFSSSSEQMVIQYILDHPHEVTQMSIRALADASFSSASTIGRLCQRLGCKGYRDFQNALLYELAAYGERPDMALSSIEPNEDGTDAIISKVMGGNMRSIEATLRLLDPEQVDACAELLLSARVIDFFGVAASGLVAQDFEMKLSRADRECHAYEDLHRQLLCAMNMHPDDVAIVISYSGQTREVVECAIQAKRRGAKVIAITQTGESPLARCADHVLGIASSEPLIRSGAMASRISQLSVVDAVFATYVAKDYEHSVSILKSNYIKKDT